MGFIALRFAVRWFANSLGLWVAGQLFANNIGYGDDLGVIILTGLVLSIINFFIKPVLVLLSLPAVILSLGLFMIVINGVTVWLASVLVSSFEIDGFGWAILAGIIIGLINYAVTTLVDEARS